VDVEFSVPFVMGMPRPRVTQHGTYTPKRAVQAKYIVSSAFLLAQGDSKPSALDDPREALDVTITTSRPLPKSRPKKEAAERDTFKPDCDNVAKLILDALNGIAYHDDAQVTTLHVIKADRKRVTSARTTVRIKTIKKEDK
jgi:Holliday junction resolvase RusA-like endonuclease